jgi:hypothetical protein
MFNRLVKVAEKNKAGWVASITVFLLFSVYYFFILYNRVATDIQVHAAIAHSFAANHDKLTPNFLYFFFVALLSGFSAYYPLYYVASIILISAAITAKFVLNDIYLKQYGGISDSKNYALKLSFLLLFVFPLPGINYFYDGNFYFGQLAATVWHNSTVIFLMPFAILLFFTSYELLFSEANGKKKKLLFQIAALIILNALIKPSFLFTLLPAAGFCLFYDILFAKKYGNKLYYLIPYAAGIAFIALEYYIIYRMNYISSKSLNDKELSSVVMAPFEVWRFFSRNIIVSLITSLLFPLVYCIVTKGQVLKNKLVQFSLLNFIFGVGIWILFAEEGARKFHANFYWQVVVTVYLLFFTMLIDFVNQIKLKKISPYKQVLVWIVFLLHFIWGLFYWMKIIIFNSYN